MLVQYSYAHEDIDDLKVIRNVTMHDEGNGLISSYTETGQQNRNK